MRQQEVYKRVKSTKGLYRDLLWYGVGNSLFILMWFIFDRNQIFWPKYTLLVWGLALLIENFRKKVFPFLSSHLFFLNGEWEERKVKELTDAKPRQHKIFLACHKKKKFKNIQA